VADIAYTNLPKLFRPRWLALEQRLAHLRENLRTPELREEFEQAKSVSAEIVMPGRVRV